jgi:hypothetical protein
MRDYGKLECSFWRNLDIRKMSEDARWLAVYILTCQHGNILGCFCLPQSYVVDDLQWISQRVSKAFTELFKNRFIIMDEKSEWLFIPKFLKWNRIENPNQGKFAVKVFNTIPNNLSIKSNLINDLREYAKHLPEQFRNSLETVVCVGNNTTVTVTDTVIVKDMVKDIVNVNPVEKYSEEFERFWKAYPKRVGKKASWTEWKKKNLDSQIGMILDLLQKLIINKSELIKADQFVAEWKDPERWIKKECWNDEIQTIVKTRPSAHIQEFEGKFGVTQEELNNRIR